jgi:hypothetical protein
LKEKTEDLTHVTTNYEARKCSYAMNSVSEKYHSVSLYELAEPPEATFKMKRKYERATK